MKMDSNAKRAALLGYVELYGLGLDYPWRYPEILNRITRDDILNVARKYLDPDTLCSRGGRETAGYTVELTQPMAGTND